MSGNSSLPARNAPACRGAFIADRRSDALFLITALLIAAIFVALAALLVLAILILIALLLFLVVLVLLVLIVLVVLIHGIIPGECRRIGGIEVLRKAYANHSDVCFFGRAIRLDRARTTSNGF